MYLIEYQNKKGTKIEKGLILEQKHSTNYDKTYTETNSNSNDNHYKP